MTTAAPRYALTPCRNCGAQIVIVTTSEARTVPLDPAVDTYSRIYDPDSGSHFWLRHEPPLGEGKQNMARHRRAGRST